MRRAMPDLVQAKLVQRLALVAQPEPTVPHPALRVAWFVLIGVIWTFVLILWGLEVQHLKPGE